ncbi:ferritin family protein [Fibrobacterota bacterium]
MAKFTGKKAIEQAIKTERKGADFYGALADRFADDEDLTEIFSRLSKDETDHEQQFTRILDSIPEESPEEDDEQSLVLQATAPSAFFTPDLMRVDTTLEAKDALARALNFERASLLHYMTLNETLQSEWLKAIIYAERKHVKVLMTVMLNDAKFRGLADTWS